MKSKVIVLKAKIAYMIKTIIKLWYIINNNGTRNNEWYFEDVVELEENIDNLYRQVTMSENEYNDYMLKQLDFNPFNESVKI